MRQWTVPFANIRHIAQTRHTRLHCLLFLERKSEAVKARRNGAPTESDAFNMLAVAFNYIISTLTLLSTVPPTTSSNLVRLFLNRS